MAAIAREIISPRHIVTDRSLSLFEQGVQTIVTVANQRPC